MNLGLFCCDAGWFWGDKWPTRVLDRLWGIPPHWLTERHKITSICGVVFILHSAMSTDRKYIHNSTCTKGSATGPLTPRPLVESMINPSSNQWFCWLWYITGVLQLPCVGSVYSLHEVTEHILFCHTCALWMPTWMPTHSMTGSLLCGCWNEFCWKTSSNIKEKIYSMMRSFLQQF